MPKKARPANTMENLGKESMSLQQFSNTLMLTIEQISHLTGVSKSTLRYWEKSFVEFLRPARTMTNRREYSIDDLDLVKTIKRLLDEEHLTAEGVRVRLEEIVKPAWSHEQAPRAQS